MAQNKRIRLEPDIEAYVRSQSERVIGVPTEQVAGADLTTLANRLLYEHKLNQQQLMPMVMQQESTQSRIPVEPSNAHQILAIAPKTQAHTQPLDDLDFAANFAAQFDEENTAA
jgi:hypothetical protein